MCTRTSGLRQLPTALTMAFLSIFLLPQDLHASDANGTCENAVTIGAAEFVARWSDRAALADTSGLAALYVEDAVLEPGAGEALAHGRTAIAQSLASLLQRHPMAMITSSTTVRNCKAAGVSGDVLVHVTGQRKGTRMLLAGSFTFDLVKRDGRWLIARHSLTLSPRPNRADADVRK